MKKTILLISLLTFSGIFAQKIDITEKEAFKRYKNSNIRKAVGMKLKEFNFKEFIKYGKSYDLDKVSNMLIFNTTKDEKFLNFIKAYSNQSLILNRDKTPICVDCNMIVFTNEKDAKSEQWNFHGMTFNPTY